MRLSRLLLFALICSCTFCFWLDRTAECATISGHVTDGKNSEPLAGVRITVVGKGTGAISKLDGSFSIAGLEYGKYDLRFAYSGYLDTTLHVDFDGDEVVDLGLVRRGMGGSKEIVVQGTTDHGSDANSMATVRNSESVINSVSARTIEVSPDISVADVTKRMSGVSVQRSSTGDAHYAIIRGMDKRYNYTTINGIKIPSPDNKNRYVPLDIFPSELVDRIEVTKTLLPSMEGDAIGGAMNMVMKQAPDHQMLTVQVGSGYSAIFGNGRDFISFATDPNDKSPRGRNGDAYVATAADFPSGIWTPKARTFVPSEFFSATAGDRYLDGKLGLIASGSYQNSYRGSNANFWLTDINQQTSAPVLREFEDRTYSTLLTRGGGMLNADYRADDDNTLQLFGLFASLQKNQFRDMWDTLNAKGGWPRNSEVTHTIRTENELQQVINATLSGTHKILGDDLQANWHLVFSRASLNNPDQAKLQTKSITSYDSLGRGSSSPQTISDGDCTREWTNSVDQDKSVYLDLKTTEAIGSLPVEFGYGGMYRAKSRTATYDKYILDPQNLYTVQRYNGDVTFDTFKINNTTQRGTPYSPLNYDAHENTAAWYVQAKVPIGNLSIVGGLRGERTDFGWTNTQPVTEPGKTGTILWADSGRPFYFLPSISFKYSPVDNQKWRASYFRSISRPNFYEAIHNDGIPGDDYREVSNDSLLPTTANNFDIRWEYFPGGLDQVLIGAFYKRLYNPIEYTVRYIQVDVEYGPNNLGDATNYGFEIDLRKYFSNFGVQGNYTYTNSQITTPKVVKHNFSGDTVNQTRPLQGQSAHVGNLALLYKDFESGTDAQLSAVYTGPAIVAVSAYKDNDIWQKGFVQLDLSAEQRIWNSVVLYAKVSNLLNVAREEVIHSPYRNSDYPQLINGQTNGEDILVRKEIYNRNFILGLRYKM